MQGRQTPTVGFLALFCYIQMVEMYSLQSQSSFVDTKTTRPINIIKLSLRMCKIISRYRYLMLISVINKISGLLRNLVYCKEKTVHLFFDWLTFEYNVLRYPACIFDACCKSCLLMRCADRTSDKLCKHFCLLIAVYVHVWMQELSSLLLCQLAVLISVYW